jgi:uncharacterized protein YecT (DUF1311 family)
MKLLRFQFVALTLAGVLGLCPSLLAEPQQEQNQQQLNAQAEKDFQTSDAELNRLYKQLMKKLTGTSKEKLIQSQSLWIKFRDAEADARASEFEGGSIVPMIYAGSRNHTTKARIADLKEWLNSFR